MTESSSPPKAPRQTRPAREFDHKIGFISLRALDYVVLAAIALFLLAALIDTMRSYPQADLYLFLSTVHDHFGRFSLAVALFMFGMSLYIGLARRADVTPYFRRGTYVVLGMMLFQAAMGAIMTFILGIEPGAPEHLLYGLGTVLALPFFIFVETTAEKRPAMGSYMWGFALLAGIIVRSISTGG